MNHTRVRPGIPFSNALLVSKCLVGERVQQQAIVFIGSHAFPIQKPNRVTDHRAVPSSHEMPPIRAADLGHQIARDGRDRL